MLMLQQSCCEQADKAPTDHLGNELFKVVCVVVSVGKIFPKRAKILLLLLQLPLYSQSYVTRSRISSTNSHKMTTSCVIGNR